MFVCFTFPAILSSFTPQWHPSELNTSAVIYLK